MILHITNAVAVKPGIVRVDVERKEVDTNGDVYIRQYQVALDITQFVETSIEQGFKNVQEQIMLMLNDYIGPMMDTAIFAEKLIGLDYKVY